MRWFQPLLYVWAAPATLLGLLPVPLVKWQGGTVRVVGGVVEVSGGIVSKMLSARMPVIGGAAALTLGHVVWGASVRCLHETRAHERVHVRQYERWGPFFLPAYGMASLVARFRGRHPYYDNMFEREAYDEAP